MRSIPKLILLTLALLGLKVSMGQSVGLVLSGGGVRGMAHIGVIRALEEENIPIDFITGTSAGALVGALYASGLTPAQIELQLTSKEFIQRAEGKFNEENSYFLLKPEPDASIASIQLLLDSTLKTQIPSNVVNTSEIDFGLMESLALPSAISGYRFDSLLVPFRCIASDITAKKPVVFTNGDLARAVRASMAFPFYFPPVIIGKNLYYDGGIYDNFPSDIMLEAFNPDIIIGVNTMDDPILPAEGNFLSQLKYMIQQNQQVSLPRSNDILIQPTFGNTGTLEFERAKAAIDSGYTVTKRMIADIRKSVQRSADSVSLSEKRAKLRGNRIAISIDKISVNGINSEQAEYVKSVLNPFNGELEIKQAKRNWFKLVADENQSYIYPSLIRNTENEHFELNVDVRRKKGITIDFGGIISSKPINTGYVSAHHRFWGQQSILVQGNLYFGKLYNSAMLRMRLDLPGRLPFFVEPTATISQYDYFKSSSSFFTDIKPSFLLQQERMGGLIFGLPVRHKGKLTTNIQTFQRKDKYYLTRSFLESDTADLTKLDGFIGSLCFERNTFNRKMYPNQGHSFEINLKAVYASEETIPGSTGFISETSSFTHRWFQLGMRFDHYLKPTTWFKTGFLIDMQFSGMPFLSNQTATLSLTPAFQPIPEMQTLFLESFRAHNYFGMGVKSIFSFNEDLDFRLEGYMFQPFQEILRAPDYQSYYGDAFGKRYFAGTGNLVYQSPAGPISLALNYIESREKPFSVMFHIGYLLFNKRLFQ